MEGRWRLSSIWAVIVFNLAVEHERSVDLEKMQQKMRILNETVKYF